MEDYTILKEKISYFKEQKISVHITKKELIIVNGITKNKIHNGIVLEFNGNLLILDEEIVGTMPIYLSEIKDIERRKEK